jgi:hypothetical protein
MSRSDWQVAENHFDEECEEAYLREAIAIQQEFFANPSDLGAQRIRENKIFQRHEAEFEEYLPNVIKDLNDLFSGC